MRKSNLAKLMAVLLASAMVLSGCGGSKDEEPRETKRKEQPDSAEAADEGADTEESEGMESEFTPEEMDLIKYNYYVELNNDIIDVMDSIDYYYAVVDYAEEFTLLPDTGLTYGFSIYGKNTDTLDDCVLLADMEPSYGEMDNMVKELEAPLRALMEVFSDISRSNDFADNQYQKAKEYHEIVYGNTDAFDAVAYDFVDAIAEMSVARVEEEENKMKEEGRLIQYNASRAITLGREVLNEAYSQGVNDANLNDLDLAEIQKIHDELVAVVADFDAATADNDQLVKESLSNSRPFDGLLNGLIDALEWTMKQAESGVLPDMEGNAPLGSLEHFSIPYVVIIRF